MFYRYRTYQNTWLAGNKSGVLVVATGVVGRVAACNSRLLRNKYWRVNYNFLGASSKSKGSGIFVLADKTFELLEKQNLTIDKVDKNLVRIVCIWAKTFGLFGAGAMGYKIGEMILESEYGDEAVAGVGHVLKPAFYLIHQGEKTVKQAWKEHNPSDTKRNNNEIAN